MHGCRCNTALFILLVLSLLVSSATGRRGCLNYGHSCLGAHGKRSSNRQAMRRDIANFLPLHKTAAEYNTISEENLLRDESDTRKWNDKWRDMVSSTIVVHE
uniref:Uncharacterized protein n=1 Tax=Strigamia maritima TaxID=126957 RepID=T1IXA5_STRMM